MVNAYAKIELRHAALFDEVAKASIPIIDTFNSQELANMVNAYTKMDHRHPVLFDEVAKAIVPIIDFFNSQELANAVSGFARAGHGSQAGRSLYHKVADTIKNNPAYLDDSTDMQLVAWKDEYLLGMIGMEITGRGGQLMLHARNLGNLASACSCHPTPITVSVLQLTFENYLEQVSRSEGRTLESTADIFQAIPSGQRLKVVPSDFLEDIAKLATEYSREARMEDVRDIPSSVSRVDKFDQQLRHKPLFDKHRTDISPKRRNLIHQSYDGFDTLL
jgi:hypothetical protein